MTRGGLSLACLAVVVAGGVGWAVTRPTAQAGTPPHVTTGTAPVTRTTVVQSQQVAGTLGYAGTRVAIAAGDPGRLNQNPRSGNSHAGDHRSAPSDSPT
ncbi:hypothetical protein AB0J09_34875, partial [Nonomuraea sp. NPDC049784]